MRCDLVFNQGLPEKKKKNKKKKGNFLAVQWLGLHATTAGGPGSIPGWGTKLHKLSGAAKKKKTAWVQIQTPPLTCSVTLGTLLDLSVPQFLSRSECL